MGEPKGYLILPIGFNPSDDVRAFTVDVNDYLKTALEAGLSGSAVGEPKGRIVTICGVNPDGDIRAIELDANDNVLISLLGGSANQVIKSDGTDAEWDDLSDVIEAAILTADGDIMIRSGGVVQRLAKPAVGEILGESSQIPAWIAKPSGGYTEGARVYRNANQIIPTGEWTAVIFTSEDYDTDDIFENVTNPTRLTCKTAGKYQICGNPMIPLEDQVRLDSRIRLNGSSDIDYGRFAGSGHTRVVAKVNTQYVLAVNDYVELHVYHDAGVNETLEYGAGRYPYFMMQRIG